MEKYRGSGGSASSSSDVEADVAEASSREGRGTKGWATAGTTSATGDSLDRRASVVLTVAVSERWELDRDRGSAVAEVGDEKVRELDRDERVDRELEEYGLEVMMGEDGGVAIELRGESGMS